MHRGDEQQYVPEPATPAVWFWILAALLFAFLFGASAPSPLYPIYQREFGFSAITVTAVYAAYAATGLASLLVSGRLSDYVGRRLVVIVALVIQIVSMLAFIAAQGELMLYVARLVQGLATGIAIGAISAWLVDLQPPGRIRLGALAAGAALLLGLGSGAIGASLLAQLAPDPLRLVYWVLAAAYIAGLICLPFIPDVVARRPGWRQSFRPEISVPTAARSLFAAAVPSLVATWALAGFYLSLGPALANSLLGGNSAVAGGLVIVLLLGTAAAASVVVRDAEPRALMIRGSLLLIIGVGVTLAGVAIGSAIALYAGSLIAGVGVGAGFSAAVRSVVPLAPPDERGGLISAIYIVVYVSFSVPAILAGLGVNLVGLREATYAYGVVVIGLAAITMFSIARRSVPASVSQPGIR